MKHGVSVHVTGRPEVLLHTRQICRVQTLRVYIYIYLHIYYVCMYEHSYVAMVIVTASISCNGIITASTCVLLGKVRFDCAGPMFCEILRVVHLGRWMTKIYSLISTHFINMIIIINITSIIIPT